MEPAALLPSGSSLVSNVISLDSEVIFCPSIYCSGMSATLYKTQAVTTATNQREPLVLLCKQAGGYFNTLHRAVW